jgi:Amt family ammonium transporter
MWKSTPTWKPIPWAWSPLAKRVLIVAALAGLLLVLITGLALAGDPTGASTGTANDVAAQTVGNPTTGEIAAELGHVKISLNIFFLIFGGALVFFMQAGFAMVETGFSRSKNAVHVIMTNFVIFSIGAVAYWAVGFAFMFGGAGTFATLGGTQALSGEAGHLIGTQGFFLSGHTYDVAIIAMFFFQLVFMDTTATIPTGAMAERWKFSAFAIYGVFIAAILYPIYGNWVWGGGWLSQLGKTIGLGHGVVDFAGSGVVHAVGGFAALAGAVVLGARIGKFGKDGKPRASRS